MVDIFRFFKSEIYNVLQFHFVFVEEILKREACVKDTFAKKFSCLEKEKTQLNSELDRANQRVEALTQFFITLQQLLLSNQVIRRLLEVKLTLFVKWDSHHTFLCSLFLMFPLFLRASFLGILIVGCISFLN